MFATKVYIVKLIINDERLQLLIRYFSQLWSQ